MARPKKIKPTDPETQDEQVNADQSNPAEVEAVNGIITRVVSLDELKELEVKKLIIGYNQVTKEAKYREAA